MQIFIKSSFLSYTRIHAGFEVKICGVFWAKYVETLLHRRSLCGYAASISYTTPASHVSNPTNLEIPGFFTIGNPDIPGYILLDIFIMILIIFG